MRLRRSGLARAPRTAPRAIMDLNSIPLMSMLAKRMAWRNQRQSVLAQNVANANTPNYKPRDHAERLAFAGFHLLGLRVFAHGSPGHDLGGGPPRVREPDPLRRPQGVPARSAAVAVHGNERCGTGGMHLKAQAALLGVPIDHAFGRVIGAGVGVAGLDIPDKEGGQLPA